MLPSATCRRFRLIEDDMLCASASSWQWWRRWWWWWRWWWRLRYLSWRTTVSHLTTTVLCPGVAVSLHNTLEYMQWAHGSLGVDRCLTSPNDCSATIMRVTATAPTIFQHRISWCWATCLSVSLNLRGRSATPAVRRPSGAAALLSSAMTEVAATAASWTQSVTAGQRDDASISDARERCAGRTVSQADCACPSRRNALPRNAHARWTVSGAASKMTTTTSTLGRRPSTTLWRRRQRTIRYVTSLQLDVNRYVRPTALLDDVVNMCVSAHEIMTLLRGVHLLTRVLHCAVYCLLFTTLTAMTIRHTMFESINPFWQSLFLLF